jgi:hypothetical protein
MSARAVNRYFMFTTAARAIINVPAKNKMLVRLIGQFLSPPRSDALPLWVRYVWPLFPILHL